MGPIGCPETPVITSLRCVASQKSEYLRIVSIYRISALVLGVTYELKNDRLMWRPRPSVCDLVSATEPRADFCNIRYGFLYRRLSRMHDFRVNRPSVGVN